MFSVLRTTIQSRNALNKYFSLYGCSCIMSIPFERRHYVLSSYKASTHSTSHANPSSVSVAEAIEGHTKPIRSRADPSLMAHGCVEPSPSIDLLRTRQKITYRALQRQQPRNRHQLHLYQQWADLLPAQAASPRHFMLFVCIFELNPDFLSMIVLSAPEEPTTSSGLPQCIGTWTV